MVIAITTNQAYLEPNVTDPFTYQKFNLSPFVVHRNGQPIIGIPVSSNFNHRIYFNSLEALHFLDKSGKGITLDKHPNQFVLAFDLTSTHETSHNFIHTELAQFQFNLHLREHWQPT